MTVELAEPRRLGGAARQFDAAHERAYGYAAPDVEVQLLNLRLDRRLPARAAAPADARAARDGRGPPFETRKIYSIARSAIPASSASTSATISAPGDVIEGPAAIEEAGTTTIIEPGDRLPVEDHGCLVIQLNASEAMGGVGEASNAPTTRVSIRSPSR